MSVVALVFDQLGSEAARNARAAALQLADRSFPKGSVFAVFKVGQGLAVLQSFTEDRALLPAAIEKATIGTDQARDPARRAGYDNATEEAFSLARQAQAAARNKEPDARLRAMEAQMLLFSDSVTREGQGQASLQPLLAIARALSLVQGRKSLLYFSEGLAVPPSVEDLFQSMVSTANRSNVSVYAFDARGLRVRSPTEETKLALDLARETAFSDQVGGAVPDEAVPTLGIDPSEMSRDALRLNRQGVLRDLAESTGGFLVAETNDLRPGLERVVADLRAYYEVGYVPPTPKADGRWRAISVKVSRPGVVVRTRRGYYALPPGAPVVLPYELALAEALAASPMPHDVEHRAATLRFAGGEAQTETLVWVEVPLAGLALTPGETTYRGHVSLLAQVKDETGTLVARLSHDAPIEGPLAEIESARGRTTVVRRTLRLPPGRYVLETAVQDRESGRLGARRAAFEIPAPGPSLSLGSVAIVRADEVGAVAPASDDPLRAGPLRATPLLGRSFPEGTPAVSLFFSLHAGSGDRPPEVELEFRRDGQVVSHTKPELPAPDAGGRVTYVGSFTTGSLEPGLYEVWVRGRQGDAEATEATAFTIAPRPPLAAELFRAGGAAIEDRENVAIPLTTILERASRYVREYEGTFRDLVADESYRQWGPDPKGGPAPVARTLRSDLVFIRLRGPLPWGTFRDVYEVDGQAVRDRDRRLERLLSATGAPEVGRARAILDEGSRYNLGPYRNVNAPTLGLLFLRSENQARLAFKRKGTRTIAGFPAVEVAFEEKARPTIIHDPHGRRRAGERAILDRRHPGHGPAHGDRVRPGAGQEHARLQRVESRVRRDRVPARSLPRRLRARHDDGALLLPDGRADRGRGALRKLPPLRGLGGDGGGPALSQRRRPQPSDWTERLPANSRSTSHTCGCAFAISSRVGRSSSSSSQRVRATMLAMRGWPVRIEISPKKAPSFRSPRGFCLPVTGILPEHAHPTRGEGVQARPGLALAEDRLAALEGQELQPLDDRHHLVDGEVAEERADHDLAPAAGRRPGRGGGRSGGGSRELLEDAVHEPHQLVRELPRGHRLGRRDLVDQLALERHVDLLLLVGVARVEEVVVLDLAVHGRPGWRRGDGQQRGDEGRVHRQGLVG